MNDLIEFLLKRLDDDERAARAATPGPWEINDPTYAEYISNTDGDQVVAGGRWNGEASVFKSTEDAVHIALHDPARVLREVEAKRRILDLHALQSTGRVCNECEDRYPCETLRLLALPYPDFGEEGKPDVH